MIGLCMGIPMSLLYAMIGTGVIETVKPVRSLVYLVSVYPMGIGYCAVFALVYMKMKNARLWRLLACPGRMALTNYVGQSVYGIVIFYGIGLGFGASMGLTATAAIAASVFIAETIFSALWLHYFAYGPLEWLWRMWNYKRYLPILKK